MSFDRLLRLAELTGDTLIVYNETSGRHVVVMDVDQYEELLGIFPDDSIEDDRDFDLPDVDLESPLSSPSFTPIWDSFEEDAPEEVGESWSSMGDLLEERGFEPQDSEMEQSEPAIELPDIGPKAVEVVQEISEPFYYEIPAVQEQEGSPEGEVKQVPYKSEHGEFQKEKSLDDDEPIFFEEPVE